MNRKNRAKRWAAINEPKQKEGAHARQSASLFHYTTASGLIGIIQEQVLFATHANYLNDTSELQILSELLVPQVSAEFREIVPKLIAANAFTPGLMKKYGENVYDSEAANVCRSIMRTIETISPFYLTSFCMHSHGSEEYNHGLLSQWRGYGRGGFAIEFDEAELDKLTQLESKQRSLQAIATRKVVYRNHEEFANLRAFEGLGASALGDAFREKVPALAARPDVAQILSDREVVSYIAAFITTIPFLKSPRFQEENEYRLIANATIPSQAKGDVRAAIKINFREGVAGGAVPYIRLFETLEERLPIKRIIVGPHRDQENQYSAAKLLLDQNSLDVPVVKADTTLRY
ncbi:DUF2971 domain-containing protein [Tardiphaga sp.]|uniref:DUF2971 domain-containing protein n=1 Tax=Tardiphaga sp. TaxID=1926292 RepID=UPI00262F02A9|nr:DUF2971 domain-containing protein [Tardiphaga sp.]MDB5617443.1 hypothetical protein [Tardiphaga sp.]